MYCCVTASLIVGALGDRGRTVPCLLFLFVWATIVYDPIACWTWNANGWAAKLGYLDYAGGTPVHISAGCSALAYSWVMGKRTGFKVLDERKDQSLQVLEGQSQSQSQNQNQNPKETFTSGIKNFAHTIQKRRKRNTSLKALEEGSEPEKADFEAQAILTLNSSSHSSLLVVLGTGLMWIGWIGFNAGASVVPTLRTILAVLNTHVSASCGGLAWFILDYRLRKSWSIVGLCSGIISGLVCVTPAAGFVPTWSAPIFGVMGALFANGGTKIKYLLNIDDSLDVFAVHAVGGIVGNILTAFFASQSVAALDGSTVITGGWIDHHYVQLWFQIAGTLSSAAYSFGVSAIILVLINLIPGLKLRIDPHDEINQGLDSAEHDEFAYDYIEIVRDLPETIENLFALPQSADSYRRDSAYDYEFNTNPNNNANNNISNSHHSKLSEAVGRHNPNTATTRNGNGNNNDIIDTNPANISEKSPYYTNFQIPYNPPPLRRDSRFSLTTTTNNQVPGLLEETDTVHLQDISDLNNEELESGSQDGNANERSEKLANSNNGVEDNGNTQTTFRARRNMIWSYGSTNNNNEPSADGGPKPDFRFNFKQDGSNPAANGDYKNEKEIQEEEDPKPEDNFNTPVAQFRTSRFRSRITDSNP